jgi:serine phosphatase RsbU (regulator of sigma subunit)
MVPFMPSAESNRLELNRLLDAVESSPPIDAVDALASMLRVMVGGVHVSLLVTNFTGNAVVRLSHVTTEAAGTDGQNERGKSLPLPGSRYEQVLRSQELAVLGLDEAWLILLPVTERGDAIGLLELSVPQRPTVETLEYLVAAAHALAYVLVASRRHTDVFEWGQRDVRFSLAAEIQRRLLPSSYTLEGGAFTLAGWLEPASTVGGDTFDYSLEREYLHLSITDAMGHATEAALLATLAVGSLRNSRRALASPERQAADANEALLLNAKSEQFVTGQIARIRLADGVTELVNAGHPAPYRLRDGHAEALQVVVQPPFGFGETQYKAQQFTMEPGDRFLFVTDGFLDRNAAGVDLADSLVASAMRHPREVVRELADNVLSITAGDLRDDATVLCIDWYGPGERNATAGASHGRATTT